MPFLQKPMAFATLNYHRIVEVKVKDAIRARRGRRLEDCADPWESQALSSPKETRNRHDRWQSRPKTLTPRRKHLY